MIIRRIFLFILLQLVFLIKVSISECIEGDCINGFGKYVYEDGSIYEGYWKNNYAHGSGLIYSKNGRRNFLVYEGKLFGHETIENGVKKEHIFRSTIGQTSGDIATFNKGDDGEYISLDLTDSFENTFYYKPDGSMILDQDLKSERINRWHFQVEQDGSTTFPIFNYISNGGIKSFDFYDFFIESGFSKLDRESTKENAFYEDLSKYLIMLIEGKHLDLNKKIFDRKISKEEYLCIEEYAKDIFNKDCGYNGYHEIFQYFKFYFTGYSPDWRLNNDEFKDVFSNSLRNKAYVNAWKFENLDLNNDNLIDYKEILSIISLGNNFWHHVYDYQSLGSYYTFLLYNHIISNEYNILSYEKKWEIELVKAIPYNENHIMLYANEDKFGAFNENFKKYDWNNDHIVTKDEYLTFSTLSIINNEVGLPLQELHILNSSNSFKEYYYGNLDEWNREISNYKKKILQESNEPKKSMCEKENELIDMDPYPWLYQWRGCGYLEKCMSADQMMISQYFECSKGNNASCQVFNRHLPDFKSNCELRIDSFLFN